MNGPEHFARAEATLADARTARDHGDDPRLTSELLVEALIHATLAGAAAAIHGHTSDRIQSSSAWNQALEAAS